MNAVHSRPPELKPRIPMKTKLTLLLALAITSVLHAQKPGFNGPRPVANVPSAPSRSVSPAPASGGSSSRRVNAGQIIGIAQTVLPHVIRAIQSAPKPQAAPPASQASKKPLASSRPVPVKKPVTAPRRPAKPSTPLEGKNNASLREGREIAEGLRSLEEIRKAIPDAMNDSLGLNGGGFRHGAGFEKPLDAEGNATNGSSTPQADFSPPSHSAANRGSGLTDIRGGYSRSRQGKADGPPTGSAGDSSRQGVHQGDWSGTQSRSTSSDGRTVEAASILIGPDGSREHYHEKSGDSDGDGDAETLLTRVVESVSSSGEIHRQETNRNPDGTYTTETTSLIPGETPSTSTRTTSEPPDAAPLEHIDTSAHRGCDRSPSEGAALGGVGAPDAKAASGLIDLDLLRQHANGEAPRGGVNYMTSGLLNRRQVNPGSTEVGALPASRSQSSAPLTTDTLSGPTSGGSTGGGDRPD